MDKFQEYRKYFPITEKFIYLNHASTAPLNLYSLSKASEYLKVLESEGEASWDFLRSISEETRRKLSTLLQVKEKEIAFVQNTSLGINMVIESLNWEEGDEILLLEGSFPALRYPLVYNRYGAKVVEVSMKDMKEALSAKTKLVAVEWVNYFTGERADLEYLRTLKSRHSFYLLVDAIQGVGAIPFFPKDWKVDFAVCGTSKWLLGPQGLGMLYIDEETFNDLNVGFVGWLSCPWDGFSNFSNLPEPFRDVRVFETGTKNYWALAYLGGNLDMVLDLGIDLISERIEKFMNSLMEELTFADILTPRNSERHAGIFTFRLFGVDSCDLQHYLETQRIRTSLRNGYIRISPHFYNSWDELNNFIGIIKHKVK